MQDFALFTQGVYTFWSEKVRERNFFHFSFGRFKDKHYLCIRLVVRCEWAYARKTQNAFWSLLAESLTCQSRMASAVRQILCFCSIPDRTATSKGIIRANCKPLEYALSRRLQHTVYKVVADLVRSMKGSALLYLYKVSPGFPID